jgi:hypothetical protein
MPSHKKKQKSVLYREIEIDAMVPEQLQVKKKIHEFPKLVR